VIDKVRDRINVFEEDGGFIIGLSHNFNPIPGLLIILLFTTGSARSMENII